MALTVRDQLTYLVIFSIASLFLLVRFHTLDEQSDWLRRRIGDPTAISALYLRGGTVFIIAAISGSLLLTNAASSAPLAGAWTDVGARVIEWGQFLERFLPASRSSRSLGPTFGDSTLVGLTWNTTDQLQLRVQFPPEERFPPFLAAAYYDQFRLTGWVRAEQAELSRDPGADVLAGTAEHVTADRATPSRGHHHAGVRPTRDLRARAPEHDQPGFQAPHHRRGRVPRRDRARAVQCAIHGDDARDSGREERRLDGGAPSGGRAGLPDRDRRALREGNAARRLARTAVDRPALRDPPERAIEQPVRPGDRDPRHPPRHEHGSNTTRT